MMGSDMHSLFGARHTRRRLLHFSVSACAVLAAGFVGTTARAADAGASQPAGDARELIVVGDSLSAEYGLARGNGWASLLRDRLATEKPAWTVLNASISGDTTAGGLARLPALLKQHPKIVVIELGGNDALRGTGIPEVRHNLDAMATMATAAGAKVLIAGIQVPPNYGRQYNADFAQMYVDVAAAHKAALVPFLLKGVADRPDSQDWFQADGIHPVAKAHPIILDNVWPVLKPLLRP
jgi:acyl-CoA thioesterase-1